MVPECKSTEGSRHERHHCLLFLFLFLFLLLLLLLLLFLLPVTLATMGNNVLIQHLPSLLLCISWRYLQSHSTTWFQAPYLPSVSPPTAPYAQDMMAHHHMKKKEKGKIIIRHDRKNPHVLVWYDYIFFLSLRSTSSHVTTQKKKKTVTTLLSLEVEEKGPPT